MRLPVAFALCLAAYPVRAQVPAAAAPVAPSYRGFVAGTSYREFTARARALQAAPDRPLVCRTARATAQLMECGVQIRDPADGAAFYLAAQFTDGRASLLSFGDSGSTERVEALQRELRARFGAPTRSERGLWEWRAPAGRQVVRLNWRGRAAARWMYVTLTDLDVLDRVARYVPRKP
jgi:hypothetical protein